jgi:predicted nucleic acid-binding protein
LILQALVDTNVVVSGVLAIEETSANSRILDAMLAGTLRFVLSDALLAEYREVLLRPAITARNGLAEATVDALLEDLVVNAGFPAVSGPPGDPADADAGSPVPGDEHVTALLSASPSAVLVTGDRRLREAVAGRRTVFTPAEFAAILDAPR